MGRSPFRGQHARLVPIRGFFRWLTRQNYLLYNRLPSLSCRLKHRLPKHVLTTTEVEQVMRQPNLDEPRETLYSTGMRRRRSNRAHAGRSGSCDPSSLCPDAIPGVADYGGVIGAAHRYMADLPPGTPEMSDGWNDSIMKLQ